MKAKITVIGSANVDYIMQVDRLPVTGETVTDGKFFQTFGGKGANQAVAAARAGGRVTFVGALGNDATADLYLSNLQADGIDTTHVSLETQTPSGAALVMFDRQGDNYLTVAPGSNYCVTPERVQAVEQVVAESDWIVLQQEIPYESNHQALETASRLGRPVLLNYAPAHDLRLTPDDSVHGLVVNEIEAAALNGNARPNGSLAEARDTAQQLRVAGSHRFVVVTLGKLGAVFADESGAYDAAPFSVQAIDTTAAGDTFCGSLAVGLGEGNSLAESVRFASAAAALSVTHVGAQSSIPIRNDIDSFLNT
ncbi:MAG: ribokinase [Planctomycetota bacterium]